MNFQVYEIHINFTLMTKTHGYFTFLFTHVFLLFFTLLICFLLLSSRSSAGVLRWAGQENAMCLFLSLLLLLFSPFLSPLCSPLLLTLLPHSHSSFDALEISFAPITIVASALSLRWLSVRLCACVLAWQMPPSVSSCIHFQRGLVPQTDWPMLL